MNSVTIVCIVVIVLLTAIIFGLTWLAYSMCLKAYKLEVNSGKHDESIRQEYREKKHSKTELLGAIISYCIVTVLLGLFITGMVFKISGSNLSINNHTVLVVKSGSMSKFYDEKIMLEYHNDTSLQFGIGDMCIFREIPIDEPLKKGEVYGYKNQNNIITHRLRAEYEGGYEFRGDNNPVSDYEFSKQLVQRKDVLYLYTGNKIPGLGAFVLYAQSYFGIWSLASMFGVVVGSEVVYRKVSIIAKQRLKEMEGEESHEE